MERGTGNELSGHAHAAAQARTINGGVHFHRARGRPHLVTHGVAVVSVLISLWIWFGGRGVPAPAPPAPTEAARPAGDATPWLPIPRHLDRATYRYRLAAPEPVEVLALQAYRCGDRLHSRIGLAQLEVAPWAPPADVARELVDTWARLFWGPDGAAHSHRVTDTRRLAADGGRRYLGAHVRAEVSAPSAGPCLGSTGVVHAVVLDTGGDYNVLVVVARLDGDPRHAQVPTARDVDELVAAARPTR